MTNPASVSVPLTITEAEADLIGMPPAMWAKAMRSASAVFSGQPFVAPAQAASEGVCPHGTRRPHECRECPEWGESEQSMKADCYDMIAEALNVPAGFSVVEWVERIATEHATRLSSDGGPDEAVRARMLQAYPALSAFFDKWALGPLAAPSCLCCGNVAKEVAVQHMELPGIVICKNCKSDAGLTEAELDALVWCEQGIEKFDDRSTGKEVRAVVKALRRLATRPSAPEYTAVDRDLGFDSPADRRASAPAAAVDDERAEAEQAYTISAFDYMRDPVGSRDWALYWSGWKARAALAPAADSGEGE